MIQAIMNLLPDASSNAVLDMGGDDEKKDKGDQKKITINKDTFIYFMENNGEKM